MEAKSVIQSLFSVDNLTMNNIVILNILNVSKYAYKELTDGKSSIDYATEAAVQMPDIKGRTIITSEQSETAFPGFDVYRSSMLTAAGLIELLTKLSAGYDNIIYYFGDCPLVDPKLADKMYKNHIKYFCEYTFADGFPAGIGVEIIKTSVLPMLAKLAEGTEVEAGRDTLFSLIEKDINAFEIETEISPDDQRLLRVSLFPDTRRNYLQLKSITSAVKVSDKTGCADSILETVRSRGEFLRSLPVFYEFEITSAHPQKISYMPEPWNRGGNDGDGEISAEDFSTALAGIADFSEDAVISLSIRNEPSLHSSPSGMAERVLSYPDFNLLVETSGIGWKQAELDKIAGLDQSRLTWIVDLDALDEQLYSELRGDGRAEAYAFAEMLVSEFPSNTWIQTVRMKMNEKDTEQFYKYWKEKTNNVIIQKYDWCCGRLEQRKVTDLSPVKRLPCWHLKRDLAILTDGTVPLCRDDLDSSMVCGNIFKDNLREIWEKGNKNYRQHLKGEYPGICGKCDEYYTYNY